MEFKLQNGQKYKINNKYDLPGNEQDGATRDDIAGYHPLQSSQVLTLLLIV